VEVDILLHGAGPMATWATDASPGAPVAISGTGRGYEIDPAAAAFVLAGDESALPAITTILPALPGGATAQVHVELGAAEGEQDLDAPAGVTVAWHLLPDGATAGDALVAAVLSTDLPAGAHVWVAGEAAAVQRIRRHLFEDLGIERARGTVRGYWKRD
jgi:NADPH-dependent ferric siderophore reductase